MLRNFNRNFKIGKLLLPLFLLFGLIASAFLVNSKFGLLDIRGRAYSVMEGNIVTVVNWDFDKSEGFKGYGLTSQKQDGYKEMTTTKTGAYIINRGLSKIFAKNAKETQLKIRMAVSIPTARLASFNFIAKLTYSISGNSYTKRVSISGIPDGNFVEYSILVPWWENNQDKNRVLNSFRLDFADAPVGSKISIDYINLLNIFEKSIILDCPTPQPVATGGVCTAVTGWAKNPQSSKCCFYSTPCTAPSGWQIYSNESTCLGKVLPSPTIKPTPTPLSGCPTPRPLEPGTACTQNVVWVKDPQSSKCCQYATPCQAPSGLETFGDETTCLGVIVDDVQIKCNYTVNPPITCPEGYTCNNQSPLFGSSGTCVKQ
jgi:hypothetical protein